MQALIAVLLAVIALELAGGAVLILVDRHEQKRRRRSQRDAEERFAQVTYFPSRRVG